MILEWYQVYIMIRASVWDEQLGDYVEKDKIIKWFGSLRPIDLDTFNILKD